MCDLTILALRDVAVIYVIAAAAGLIINWRLTQ